MEVTVSDLLRTISHDINRKQNGKFLFVQSIREIQHSNYFVKKTAACTLYCIYQLA